MQLKSTFIRHTLCLLLVFSVVGCGDSQAPSAPPPTAVTVATPVVKTVTRYNEYSGNTKAVNEVEVVARVPGVLKERKYELLGEDNRVTRVKADDALFEIERDVYEITRDAAQAELERAQAMEKAAEATFANMKKSFDRGAAADVDLTLAEAEYKQRVAERRGAEASLKKAELELSYTSVKAPIDGEVSRNFVDLGSYVGASGPTVLAKVTQTQPMYVYFDVSESIVLEHIDRATQRGEAVADNPPSLELGTDKDPKGTYSHKGTVDWWDRTVDRGTGTIVVRGVLDNKDASLVPGMFVRIRVPFEEMKDAILVREDAIGTDLSGKFVLTVVQNEKKQPVVKKQPIELVMRSEGGLYVVKGLAPDAQYITVGIQKVRPGMVVKPEQAVEPKPAESPAEQPKPEAEKPATQPDGSNGDSA